MTKPDKIKYGVIAFLGIAVIILLITLFKGKGSDNSELFKQLISAKDDLIQVQKEKEVIYKQVIAEKDKSIEALEGRYNNLQTNYQQSQSIYKQLNAQLQNIPIRIAAIGSNDDSIRAAFSRYQ